MQISILKEFEPFGQRHLNSRGNSPGETRGIYTLSAVQEGRVESASRLLEEDELFTRDEIVVWSRGDALVMSWDCKEFGQPVLQALWCWFDSKADNGQRMLPRDKTLCILLKDVALFHQIDGPSYTVHLPFAVEKAFALEVGLLLKSSQDKITEEETPTIFTLMHPLEQPRLLSVTSNLSRHNNEWFVPNDATIEPFVDQEEVLLVESDLMVTSNILTRHCSIWRYCQHSKPVEAAVEPFEAAWEHTRESGIRSSDVRHRKRNKSPAPHSRRPSMRPDGLMEELPVKEMQPEAQVMPVIFCQCLWTSSGVLVQPTSFLAQTIYGEDVVFFMEADRRLIGMSVNGEKVKELLAWKCLSAQSTFATRQHYKDVLMLLPDYTLALWTGGDALIPCSLPPNFQILTRTDSLSLKSFKRRRSESPRAKRHPHVRSPSKTSRVCRIKDNVGHAINLVLSDGVMFRALLDFSPESHLVTNCLDTLEATLRPGLYGHIRQRFLAHRFQVDTQGDEWTDFCTALLSFCHDKPPPVVGEVPKWEQDAWSSVMSHSSPHDFIFPHSSQPDLSSSLSESSQLYLANHTVENIGDQLLEVLYALHLVGQDLQWNVMSRSEGDQLASLLSLLVANSPSGTLSQLYPRNAFTGSLTIPSSSKQRLEQGHAFLLDPRTITSWLENGPNQPWLYNDLIRGSGPRITHSFMQSYQQLAQRGPEACIETMVRLGIQSNDVDAMPISLSIGLKEAMRMCRNNPPKNWPGIALSLIGRDDLAQHTKSPTNHYLDKVVAMVSKPPDQSSEVKSIHTIVTEVVSEKPTTMEQDWRTVGGETSRLRFSKDRRMQDVWNMFQTLPIPEVDFDEPADPEEVTKAQQNQLIQVANSLFGTLVGRGMYTFGNIHTVLTTRLESPSIHVSARLGVNRVTVSLEQDTLPQEGMEWQDFHNGVATALRINRDCDEVNSAWIMYHRPEELDANHAGFLLALGLNGHLKKLVSWQSIEYLTGKHDLTSIGLLLGLAAAYKGSRDHRVMKLLSLHVPALLPPNSNDLNVSATTQIANVFGVGLLFQASGQRKIADTMLGEIGRRQVFDGTNVGRDGGLVASNNSYREAYSLACGFALGNIMLAKGSMDANMIETLRQYIQGSTKKNVKRQEELQSAAYMDHDETPTDITAPSACVALGLMFLQSNNVIIADKLALPQTLYLLDQVRPDVLQIRSICRNLVMWDSIAPTMEWIMKEIPSYIREPVEVAAQRRGHGVGFNDEDARRDKPSDISEMDIEEDSIMEYDDSLDDDQVKRKLAKLWQNQRPVNKTEDSIASLQHAYYNLVAAGCFSIGLRFAGSGNPIALKTLLDVLDLWMQWLQARTTHSFADRLTKSVLKSCLDSIVVACGMVVCGSGNVDLLRRLRMLHGGKLSKEFGYGNHMAVHMALGLVFMSGGTTTLSTKPEAISALFASLYPKFPVDVSDNRCHLQAFRHLWVLGVEDRLLQTREVGNQQLVPVTLRLELNDKFWPKDKDGKATLEVSTPCIIPERSSVKSITLTSPRYWPMHLDRHGNWTEGNTLLIKRRVGHLNYLDDPRGLRSIHAHSLPPSLFTMQEVISSDDLQALDEFLQHFSSDPAVATFAFLFCRPAQPRPGQGMEARRLATNGVKWIWECLTQEKSEALSSMLSLYHDVVNKNPQAQLDLGLIRSIYEEWIHKYPQKHSLLTLQFIDLLMVKLGEAS